MRCLREYFGDDRTLKSITVADAEDFRRWLNTDQGIKETTIRKRIQNARMFFRHAVRAEHLE